MKYDACLNRVNHCYLMINDEIEEKRSNFFKNLLFPNFFSDFHRNSLLLLFFFIPHPLDLIEACTAATAGHRSEAHEALLLCTTVQHPVPAYPTQGAARCSVTAATRRTVTSWVARRSPHLPNPLISSIIILTGRQTSFNAPTPHPTTIRPNHEVECPPAAACRPLRRSRTAKEEPPQPDGKSGAPP